jgi:hypothetical protein
MERVSSEVTELVMGWVMELVMELVMERVSSEVTELVMGWVTAQEIDFSGFFAPPDQVADELPG